MGNQQSQEKTKEAQLWSKWTKDEREKLEKYLQHAEDSSFPSYFQRELGLGFPRQSIEVFLETAHDLIKTKPTSSAAYHLYKQVDVSLDTFVSYVVRSAVPLWFQQSGLDWEPTTEEDPQSLVHYLLFHAKEQKKRKNDEMSWLNETSSRKEEEEEAWKVKVTRKITRAEFESWAQETPGILCLIQLVAEYALLQQTPTTDLSKRRLNHLSSPSVKRNNNKKVFGKLNFSRLMNPYDYFMLTMNLPANALSWSDYERAERKVDHDVQHELIFSSRQDGISWQVFVNRLVGQGATLILIRSKDGSVFGGYADEAFELKTDWFGNASNFLFQLKEKSDVYDASNHNQHFQYLCWGKKSLPNGFGMGGQFDYAGLWIDADFLNGHSRAGPLCTTYSSPQLTPNQTFLIDEVEIWLVRPLIKEDDDESGGGGGVLSRTEDVEFMEMAGKKMYSKDLGKEPVDDDNEE